MGKKRVLIIGAGASGLVAIKSCLDEGLEPVCLERTEAIGGLWNYTQSVQEHQACVMKTTVINTSKEMMCYSDFPIPAEFPIYMHNTKVQEYFELYADKFDMLKYITFSTEILRVEPASDFDTTGQWCVKIKNKKTDEAKDEVFDAVMVCTGHHAEKNEPKFPGLDDFQGKVVHTHDYRDHKGLEDKRVLVIGIGNSGGDVAVELGRICKQVILSTRRGSWVTNRVGENGLPTDMSLIRRSGQVIVDLIPTSWFDTLAEGKLNRRFNHAQYGLQPKHRFTSQHPMVNDDLPNRIACGSVIIKPDIKQFTKTGVEFEDGTVEDNIDVVILATGFIFGYPFLDKSIIEVKNNVINLFKYAFPPDLTKPTLSVIGCIQPWGAIMPIAELQCRLSARLFKGVAQLPPKFEMWSDIRMKQRAMAERYVHSQRHTIQVDWIPFMDEVAELIGCRPDIWKIFKTDFTLFMKVFFGPCTPYQYRLHGPVQWDGARDAIMTQWDRTMAPMKTRVVKDNSAPGGSKAVIIEILLLIMVLWFFKWLIGW